MSRAWKIALALAVILLFMMSVSLAWGASQNAADQKLPVFSPKDRQIIEEYYNHLLGTLAPGSVDRSPFPLGVEGALTPNSHVPMQLEKDLQPLPRKLDAKLSQITGDYARYTLGRHVVLVRKNDLAIGDIIKNVAISVK
jgi:hypothetical protein